jgi:protein TonB
MTAVAYRTYVLPWSPAPEDEHRYRRIRRDMLIAIFALSLLMPFLPLPERASDAPVQVPQRYAKFVLERKKPPPPPPPEVVEPAPVAEAKPTPAPAAEPTPLPRERATPEPVPEAPAPRAQARERAARAGVMAFADAFADLRQNDAVAAVTRDAELRTGAGAAARTERSMITARTGKASGGIDTAGLSRDTAATGLAGRATTRVASTITPGASGPAGGGADQGAGAAEARAPARSREEIEMVFDQNKGAIYALYSRALRANPALRGKLVLRLTIAPSGEVTDCEVVSSELGDSAFERRLVSRVKMFRFEAKDVAVVTTTKPIDFFPA